MVAVRRCRGMVAAVGVSRPRVNAALASLYVLRARVFASFLLEDFIRTVRCTYTCFAVRVEGNKLANERAAAATRRCG